MKDHKIMMWRVFTLVIALFAALSLTFAPVLAPDFTLAPAFADDKDDDKKDKKDKDDDEEEEKDNDRKACRNLPSHSELTRALKNALPAGAGGTGSVVSNGGLDLPMWATIVDERGIVCVVTFSGPDSRAQWQASRPISGQKAYTTNSLTVNLAPAVFSTALLFYPTQPGQFLWGLHQSNPVDPKVVYKGPTNRWGTRKDPMVGKIPGGVNTFGGGVSLWDTSGNVIGGLGVSGDTSCADHNIALRVRDTLVAAGIGLDDNPAGQYADNIIYDILGGVSASGFGHPTCAGDPGEVRVNQIITGDKHPRHDAFPF